MINRFLNTFNFFFIILFFPSFVTGLFLPNLICGLFIFINLFFNVNKIKNLFLNYLFPSLLFILFYIIILISSILSDYTYHSLESSLLYFSYLLYSFSLIILLNDNDKFRKYFFLFGILTCLILSIDAFYEIFNGSNLIGLASIDGRIAGLFGSRWVLGRYLIYILPILVGIYFLEKEKFENYKILIFITFIFTSIIIIFSGERSAFIMFFMYLSMLFLFFLNKLPFVRLLQFFVLIIGLFILPFLFPETSERIKYKFVMYLTSTNYETNQYLSMFLTSWKMFIENPIFGIGPNAFRFSCSESIYYVSKWSCSTHPHNIFFQLLAEVGILGSIFVYSVLIYFILKSIKLVFSKNFSYSSFGIYSLKCSIILYLFPLMITGNFFLSWYGFIFYLPISLYVVYSNKLD